MKEKKKDSPQVSSMILSAVEQAQDNGLTETQVRRLTEGAIDKVYRDA